MNTDISISGLSSQAHSDALNGGPDANGQAPESVIAAPGINPCRHCLGFIAEGEPMLIMAHRPFPQKQAYAEVGPIFLHDSQCQQYSEDALPAWLMMADQDGFALCGFDSPDDLRHRFFDSRAGRIKIGEDVANFSDLELSPRKLIAMEYHYDSEGN